MNEKSILTVTVIILLVALIVLGKFLGSSFPEWMFFFFAVIFTYALFMRFNILDVLHNSKTFSITAFCLVATVSIQSIRDFSLISVYQVLSTIAGLGTTWLLIRYIRSKSAENQSQTNQT